MSDPQATLTAFAIDCLGQVHARLTDGTEFTCCQILLQNVTESFLLVANPSGVYTNPATAGLLPLALPPGTGGLGRIESGALEVPEFAQQEFVLPSREFPRLRITGEPGLRWTIQATTNLTDWIDLRDVSNTPDELELCDDQSNHYSRRFYRVTVSQP